VKASHWQQEDLKRENKKTRGLLEESLRNQELYKKMNEEMQVAL